MVSVLVVDHHFRNYKYSPIIPTINSLLTLDHYIYEYSFDRFSGLVWIVQARMAPKGCSESALVRPIIFTQDACLQHRNIKSDASGRNHCLERPERLHAVNIGIAAAFTRLEEACKMRSSGSKSSKRSVHTGDDVPFTIVRSTASLASIQDHPAARAVLHIKDEDDPEALSYAESLELWCKESRNKIVRGLREVPPEFDADLYRRYPKRPGLLLVVPG
jgi:hypothetical protein